MPGSTGAPWNLEYPLATEAPNGPAGIQALAEDTAAGLGKAYVCTSSTRPAHAAGRMIFETDTGFAHVSDGATWWQIALGDDTGWQDAISAGVVAAANVTLISGQIRRRNGMVGMYLSVSHSAGFSAGDVGNVTLVTVPAAYTPFTAIGLIGGGANLVGHTSYVSNVGNVVISSTVGAIGAGSTFNVVGTYML